MAGQLRNRYRGRSELGLFSKVKVLLGYLGRAAIGASQSFNSATTRDDELELTVS